GETIEQRTAPGARGGPSPTAESRKPALPANTATAAPCGMPPSAVLSSEARRSALAVLRRLAGLLQTGLLALGDAGVPGEETGLLQRRTVQLFVDAVE